MEGRLHSRSYDDKDGKKVYTTEVVADDVILLGGRGEGGGPGQSGQSEGGYQSGNRPSQGGRGKGPAGPPSGRGDDDPFGGMGITDDDVPF